jgi:hypothetical protein
MAVQGQQPGESDRDYIRRLATESTRQQRAARDSAHLDSLNREAYKAREQRADAVADADADAVVKDLLGVTLVELQAQAAKGAFDKNPEVKQAVSSIVSAAGTRKSVRGKKIKKVTKANKAALKEGAKITKKNKGCAVTALAMLGGLATAISWGGYEVVSAFTA